MAVDALTFLGSSETIASKTFSPAGCSDYDVPLGPFVVRRIPVADLDAAVQVILACPANAFVVRGATDADQIPYRRHRARDGEPATLAAEAHRLLPVDMDPIGPAPRTDLEAMVREARGLLPAAFHDARCLAIATSNAGIKPGIRARLWFWCDRPVSDTDAKAWLAGYADTAIYTPSQPIYCAAPRFIGVPDPFAGRARWCLIEGTAEVRVPNAIERVKSTVPATGWTPAPPIGTRNTHLTSIAGSMRARGLDARAIGAALREHNATFPEPLPDAEVKRIAESVERYTPDAVIAPPPSSRDAAEKAARKGTKRVSEDPALVSTVAADLARFVRQGSLSEGQAVTALRKGLDAADVATAHSREDLAGLLNAAPAIEPQVPHWATRCIVNEDGVIVPCPENLKIVLQHHPDVSLWWNSRAQLDMWERCPWHSPGPVLPTDDFALRAWVSRELAWHKCPAEPLAAVAEVARQRQWDPWRSFLEGLQWDGEQRLHRAAHELFGAPDAEVYALCFSWWLLSAVARSLDPGCQVDHVIVLEGPQGLGKTSMLRTLAMHDAFFTRLVSGADLSSPRTIGKIHGPVIVEMAELAVMRRAEIESIKAFVDERTDRVQWLYARKPVDVQRSCVFAASTNDEEYLRDVTGNRRFWPMPCGRLDVERLAEVRDQLWAEAVALYRAGCPWWPTREQMREIGLEALQASRQESEPVHDAIVDVLSRALAPGRHPLTGTMIDAEHLDRDGRLVRCTIGTLCELAGLSAASHARTVTRVLKMLGWGRLTAHGGTGNVRLWTAPTDRGRWTERAQKTN